MMSRINGNFFCAFVIVLMCHSALGIWTVRDRSRESWRDFNEPNSWSLTPRMSGSGHWNFGSLPPSFGQLVVAEESWKRNDHFGGQSQSDDPSSKENVESDTWLSSSYLTPPPRPKSSTSKRARKTGGNGQLKMDRKMYDYSYYDQTTYNIPNIMRLYQNNELAGLDPNFKVKQHNGNGGYRQKEPRNKLKSYEKKNGNMANQYLISSPIKNEFERKPIVEFNMEKVMDEVQSICSYFGTSMEFGYFCRRKTN